MKRRSVLKKLGALVALPGLGLVGCGGGGSSSGGGPGIVLGRSTVNGNVSSIDSGGGTEGIFVEIDNMSTNTDGVGNFSISGVGTGSKSVRFSRGTSSAALPIQVTDNAVITLRNVSISGSNASTDAIIVNSNSSGVAGSSGSSGTSGSSGATGSAGTSGSSGSTGTSGSAGSSGSSGSLDDDDDDDNGSSGSSGSSGG